MWWPCNRETTRYSIVLVLGDEAETLQLQGPPSSEATSKKRKLDDLQEVGNVSDWDGLSETLCSLMAERKVLMEKLAELEVLTKKLAGLNKRIGVIWENGASIKH